MISNQVLKNTLEGLKEISRIEFCVIDTDGKVLASTFPEFTVEPLDIQAFVNSAADSQMIKGIHYFKVNDDYQLEYILAVSGDDEDSFMVGKLAAFQIQNLIIAYKERFDKDSFIKNLLLDNLLLVDIYNRAKKLHIETDVRRVVMILELSQEKDHNSVESLKAMFGGKNKNFITAVDEKSVIIVRELDDGLPMRGSSNQRLIFLTNRLSPGDMPDSRTNKIIFTEKGFRMVGIPSKGAKELLGIMQEG